jgi:hypothetical protein
MESDLAQQRHNEQPARPGKGKMTVEEAGRLGGHKGGQRVKELIEEGKRAEQEDAGEEMDSTQEEADEGEA